MIVRPRPRSWQLLYIMRGSIVPAIAPKVAVIFVVGVLTSAFAVWVAVRGLDSLGVGPFTLLGLALSIFLSFRNNACHERWWEGRKLWGQLVFESRSLARECQALLPDDAALRQRVLHLAIGFAAALAARLGMTPAQVHDALQPPQGRHDFHARVRTLVQMRNRL